MEGETAETLHTKVKADYTSPHSEALKYLHCDHRQIVFPSITARQSTARRHGMSVKTPRVSFIVCKVADRFRQLEQQIPLVHTCAIVSWGIACPPPDEKHAAHGRAV